MGRIVRCAGTGKVSTPMYVAAAGIHLYSLEELSYFLQHFLYLVDENFFDSELLRFLREELKRQDLAELVLSRLAQVRPVLLAGELALAIGDMNESEKAQLRKKITAYQKMSVSGRKKLQADMLLKRGEYDQAESIYLLLLSACEDSRDRLTGEEIGEIYYNMGKIHMAAFEWKAAGADLVKSYELLQQESVLQELFELSCISPVEVCDRTVFSGVHGITIRRWQEHFNQKKDRIEKALDEIDYEEMMQVQAAGAEGLSMAEALCREWRQDFRKIRKSCCQGDIFSV